MSLLRLRIVLVQSVDQRLIIPIIVDVAQLAKRSVLTPEVGGLNSVIGEIFTEHC